MNSYTLRLIATIAFSLAAAALILAVILWFTLKIKDVIGFLTGRSQKKAAENFSGTSGYGLNKRTKARFAGRTTSGKAPEVKMRRTPVEATAPLDAQSGAADTVPLNVEGTMPLNVEGTMPLSEETTLLSGGGAVEETTLLEDAAEPEGTTLLDAGDVRYSDFVVTESIVMVHTNEKISFKTNKSK